MGWSLVRELRSHMPGGVARKKKVTMFAFQDAYSRVNSVQLISRVWLFATPWTAAHQASLSITNSWSLLKLTSIELVMPSNHLILQPSHPLSSPSPPAFNLSQHQDLFKWVSSSHQVAKVLGFQGKVMNKCSWKFFYSIRNTTMPTWTLDAFWCLVEPVEKGYKITVIYMERKINLPLPHFAIISKGTLGFTQESPGGQGTGGWQALRSLVCPAAWGSPGARTPRPLLGEVCPPPPPDHPVKPQTTSSLSSPAHPESSFLQSWFSENHTSNSQMCVCVCLLVFACALKICF